MSFALIRIDFERLTAMRQPLFRAARGAQHGAQAGVGLRVEQGDRLGIATRQALEWRQVVVLKGAHTVVADADGRAAVSPFANPALSRAGTGDVLSGAIAGFLAQGLDRYAAASCGVVESASSYVTSRADETVTCAPDASPW